MTPDDWTQLVQGLVAIGGTVGGVWFVLRLVVGYQRDFTDRYQSRLHSQDDRIGALESKVATAEEKAEKAELAVRQCEAREHALIARLAEAGVDL